MSSHYCTQKCTIILEEQCTFLCTLRIEILYRIVYNIATRSSKTKSKTTTGGHHNEQE